MEIWQLIVLIGTFLGSLASVGISAFVYARKGGTDAVAASNELLRKLVDDQADEISRMRTGNHERDNKIQELGLDVERLKAAKIGLANMIQEALVAYFKSEPKIIEAAQALISESKKEERGTT